MNHKKSMLICV